MDDNRKKGEKLILDGCALVDTRKKKVSWDWPQKILILLF